MTVTPKPYHNFLSYAFVSSGQRLEESLEYQQFVANVEEEEAWINEKMTLVASEDYGDTLAAIQVSEKQEPCLAMLKAPSLVWRANSSPLVGEGVASRALLACMCNSIMSEILLGAVSFSKHGGHIAKGVTEHAQNPLGSTFQGQKNILKKQMDNTNLPHFILVGFG